MDERANSRIVTNEPVWATSTRHSWQASMYNMSTTGCAVESQGDDIRLGDNVRLTIEDLPPFDGKAVWARGYFAGIAFDNPVHADIVMYLGFKEIMDFSEADLRADQPNFAQRGFACPKVLVSQRGQAA